MAVVNGALDLDRIEHLLLKWGTGVTSNPDRERVTRSPVLRPRGSDQGVVQLVAVAVRIVGLEVRGEFQ